VWEKNQTWKGLKVHTGRVQEAYDVECAAIARALESAARRRNKLDHLTIFTDAQAAIWRMTSDDPGTGQRQGNTLLNSAARSQGSGSKYGGAPATAGSKADEWAKQAADELDARGVEWHIQSRLKSAFPAVALSVTALSALPARRPDGWTMEASINHSHDLEVYEASS